jgi:hypothetical protein
MREMWACDEPAQMAVWDDGENEFYNCPMGFVAAEIREWFNEYAYCEQFKVGADYGQRQSRWIDALFYYKSKLCEFQEMARPKGNSGRSGVEAFGNPSAGADIDG